MKRIVAIETSTLVGSVCLAEDGKSIAELTAGTRATHSASLLGDLDWLLARVGWTTADIDGLVVSVGPGSFTAVRIGMTTARTLAWTLDKPLVGVSSLELLALNGRGRPGLVASMLDARKKEVYTAVYRTVTEDASALAGAPIGAFEELLEPSVLPPGAALERVLAVAEGQPLWIVGDGVERYPTVFVADAERKLAVARPQDHLPRGGLLAALGHERLEAADWSANPTHVVPLYVRPSEAELAAQAREEAEREAAARAAAGQ